MADGHVAPPDLSAVRAHIEAELTAAVDRVCEATGHGRLAVAMAMIETLGDELARESRSHFHDYLRGMIALIHARDGAGEARARKRMVLAFNGLAAAFAAEPEAEAA